MISSSPVRQQHLRQPPQQRYSPPMRSHYLESQVLQLLSLCDATVDQQCNPLVGNPPQIQAIQLILQLQKTPERLCDLWCEYHSEIQTRINALYGLMTVSEGCQWCRCPRAGICCEPKEHYFVLVSLLQDLQIQCDRCPA